MATEEEKQSNFGSEHTERPRGGKLLLGDQHGGIAISRGAAVLLLNRSLSVYIKI